MDPAVSVPIILASLTLVGSIIAHLRIRSKCHIGDVLDISLQKEMDNDLGKAEPVVKDSGINSLKSSSDEKSNDDSIDSL